MKHRNNESRIAGRIGRAVVFVTGVMLAASSCSSTPGHDPLSVDPGGHLRPSSIVRLERVVDARQIAVVGGQIYLSEGWPEQQVSHWSPEGKDLGPVFERGRAPWKMLEASEDLLDGGYGRLGLIDMRSYRLTFIDANAVQFSKSFLVSGYEFMPLGGVSDPLHDRIYLFANNEPEVRVLDFEGRLVDGFDLYQEEYTDPYAWFRGTVDRDGNLLYCPRTAYQISRVAPDGSVSSFATSPGPDYIPPLPLPDPVKSNPSDTERRFEWEKTVSWIDRLASTGDYVLVSYSVPPGLEHYRVDLYSDDGTALATRLESPGRLLGCDRDLTCWFLDSSHTRLVSRRVTS